jgi:acetate kinase
MHELGADAPQRITVAHLGNGASVTAIADGASVDTSMGLTPTGGVIMGARTGDLDPGVLLHLMRTGVSGADELEKLLDKESSSRVRVRIIPSREEAQIARHCYQLLQDGK